MTRVRPARSVAELREQIQGIVFRASGLLGPARATRLGADDAADALTRRPKPDSWSAAECIAHLNMSIDVYFPVWEQLFAGGVPPKTSGTCRLDLWGRILVWTLEPPPRFRFGAPKAFQPAVTEPGTALVSAFLERQQAFQRVLDRAEGLAIDKVSIVSPFDRRVRYSMWSSFCVAAAHERRHLWQAEHALHAAETAATG